MIKILSKAKKLKQVQGVFSYFSQYFFVIIILTKKKFDIQPNIKNNK